MADLTSVQISGDTVQSINNAFLSQRLATKFIQNALGEEVNSNAWYPAEKFLVALRNISNTMDPMILKRVGKKIIESAKWPPGVIDAESGLKSISVAYKMNHKPNNTAVIGDYLFKKVSDTEFKIKATNPYPCEFDEGIIDGVANAFGQKAKVTHLPGICRHKGKEGCVYHIELL